VAEKSVTLLSNDDSLLPLKLVEERKLLVLSFPSESFGASAELFARELKVRHKATSSHVVLAGSSKGVQAAISQAQAADVIAVLTYGWGGRNTAKQQKFLDTLFRINKPVMLISTLNPYEVAKYPGARTVLLTYSATPSSMKAAARVIFGEIVPVGQTPVTISDRFRRGTGNKY
jgi:beta-N-acetylhexosaminidase